MLLLIVFRPAVDLDAGERGGGKRSRTVDSDGTDGIVRDIHRTSAVRADAERRAARCSIGHGNRTRPVPLPIVLPEVVPMFAAPQGDKLPTTSRGAWYCFW